MKLANTKNLINVALRSPGMREPLVLRGITAGSTVEECIQSATHSATDPRKLKQLEQEISGPYDVLLRSDGILRKLDRKSRLTGDDTPDNLYELELHRYLDVGA